MSVSQNLVTFYCPGTFVAETVVRPIESWDVAAALEMAKGIQARYRSAPYGFRFITRTREDNALDSKETARSGMYFINGVVATLDEIIAQNDPNDSILIENMKANGWQKVVTTYTPYSWTQPLGENDVVLAFLAAEASS